MDQQSFENQRTAKRTAEKKLALQITRFVSRMKKQLDVLEFNKGNPLPAILEMHNLAELLNEEPIYNVDYHPRRSPDMGLRPKARKRAPLNRTAPR